MIKKREGTSTSSSTWKHRTVSMIRLTVILAAKQCWLIAAVTGKMDLKIFMILPWAKIGLHLNFPCTYTTWIPYRYAFFSILRLFPFSKFPLFFKFTALTVRRPESVELYLEWNLNNITHKSLPQDYRESSFFFSLQKRNKLTCYDSRIGSSVHAWRKHVRNSVCVCVRMPKVKSKIVFHPLLDEKQLRPKGDFSKFTKSLLLAFCAKEPLLAPSDCFRTDERPCNIVPWYVCITEISVTSHDARSARKKVCLCKASFAYAYRSSPRKKVKFKFFGSSSPPIFALDPVHVDSEAATLSVFLSFHLAQFRRNPQYLSDQSGNAWAGQAGWSCCAGRTNWCLSLRVNFASTAVRISKELANQTFSPEESSHRLAGVYFFSSQSVWALRIWKLLETFVWLSLPVSGDGTTVLFHGFRPSSRQTIALGELRSLFSEKLGTGSAFTR